MAEICLSGYEGRSHPVDTGCKLNVHQTFRRRPGRLLNILCTFNLRPMSTGQFHIYFQNKAFLEYHCPECVHNNK